MHAAVVVLALSLMGVSPAPEAVLKEVQTSYAHSGDLSASFAQTYVDKLRGRLPTEHGKLWVKADGRVRWSYQKPTPKDFIYDGKKAYFYEPQNAQVTVFEQFEDSQLSTAMRFLWGQGDLKALFEAKPCDASCKVGDPGDWKIRLVPRHPLPTVKSVVLAVDPQSKRPRVSVIYDPLGNRTEYAFSDFVKETQIPSKKFRFKIPKNVSVLRSALSGK